MGTEKNVCANTPANNTINIKETIPCLSQPIGFVDSRRITNDGRSGISESENILFVAALSVGPSVSSLKCRTHEMELRWESISTYRFSATLLGREGERALWKMQKKKSRGKFFGKDEKWDWSAFAAEPAIDLRCEVEIVHDDRLARDTFNWI